MNNTEIVTGQFVVIEQVAASVGDRMAGRGIDMAIQAAYFAAMSILLDKIDIWAWHGSSYPFYFTSTILPICLYTFVCERFFGGQTIGKRLMHTRVVMADGSAPTTGALLLRWILELVDIYTSLIGLVVIICNKKNQRIGDIAAGTMVVKSQPAKLLRHSLDEYDYARAAYKPVYPEAQNLSLAQADVISKVVGNEKNIDNGQIEALAEKVSKVLGVSPKGEDDRAFLSTVLKDYRHYALELI